MNDGHTNVLSHSNLNVPDAIVNVDVCRKSSGGFGFRIRGQYE
jgi:hypothetical protein